MWIVFLLWSISICGGSFLSWSIGIFGILLLLCSISIRGIIFILWSVGVYGVVFSLWSICICGMAFSLLNIGSCGIVFLYVLCDYLNISKFMNYLFVFFVIHSVNCPRGVIYRVINAFLGLIYRVDLKWTQYTNVYKLLYKWCWHKWPLGWFILWLA